jgi:hypothetical protein
MPATYVFDPTRSWLLTHISGPVGIAEIRQHLQSERSLLYAGYPQLMDATQATPRVTAEDVRAVADQVREMARSAERGPTAIVVKDDVAYGMLRMVEVLAGEACAIRPFRSFLEAENWLAGFAEASRGQSADPLRNSA